MRSFLPLVALSLSVLSGLLTGCAPAQPRREPAAGSTVTSRDLQDLNEPIEMVLQKARF